MSDLDNKLPGWVLFVLIGGIFLVCGLRTMIENLHIVLTGLRTTGVVVAKELDSSGRHPVSYPVVRFVLRRPVPAPVLAFGHFVPDRTGHLVPVRAGAGGDAVRAQTYEVQGTAGTDPPEFHVGQHVTVLYDPQHPESALIDSWRDLWQEPVGMIVIESARSRTGRPARRARGQRRRRDAPRRRRGYRTTAWAEGSRQADAPA
jgi:hypothetical protein